METEYLLQYRYGDDAKWQHANERWTDKSRAIRSWARASAEASSTPWQYRIVSREVTEWEPIRNMEEALAVLSEQTASDVS